MTIPDYVPAPHRVEDDNQGAFDGYAQINTFFECKDGVSIGFITIVALGILTMWYILFTKITMGRRKRELSYDTVTNSHEIVDIVSYIKSAILSGTFICFGFCLSSLNCEKISLV